MPCSLLNWDMHLHLKTQGLVPYSIIRIVFPIIFLLYSRQRNSRIHSFDSELMTERFRKITSLISEIFLSCVTVTLKSFAMRIRFQVLPLYT